MAFYCLLIFVSGLTNAFAARTSPSPIFINAEPLQPPEIPPQVDAVIFWNRSLFIVTNSVLFPFDPAPTPYEAKSVLFWTNNGTMVGLPGFKFEMVPERSHLTAAQRRRRGATLPRPSASFYNDGEITVSDYLLVHATQMQNPGLIAGDIRARMRFNVTNGLADFSRGAVHVGNLPQPLCTSVSNFIFGPFFFGLDPAVSYAYLDSGFNGSVGTNRFPLFLPTLTDSNFFFSALFAPPNPRPPFSEYRQFVGTNVVTNTLFTLQSCGSYDAFVHLQTNVTFFATNIFGTNFFIRDRSVSVVFVPTNGLSTNVSIGIAFPTNALTDAPIVEFRAAYFDVIEQRQATNFVTFRDDGSSIFRGHDCQFDQFAPANAPFSANLFYDPRFDTNFVDYFYTVAQAQVGETNSIYFTNTTTTTGAIFPALGTSLAASNPTNKPGTVNINARDLDLSNSRLRAENGIFIRATNLVGNANSFIDAPFVTFDVGAASGRLVISNLAQAQVNRVQASLNSWAGSWSLGETNGFVTNLVLLTNGTFTNIVFPVVEAVNFHVLILGACVDALHPSIIHDLTLRATNVVIQDQLAINQSFLVQGQSLTFGSNSSLMLPRGANLAFTNVQNVTSFTNDGVLNIPDGAYFGAFEDGFVQPRQRRRRRNAAPRLVTYENFVNHGSISAASVSARAAYVEDIGHPFAPAIITATNGAVKLDGALLVISNANITATSDIRLTAGDALIARSALTAGATNGGRFMNTFLPGSLIVDATNSLTDGGVGASNDWRVTSGVRLVRRPQPIDPDDPVGDLMGTRIVVRSGTFAQSVIQWAAEDRGASVTGFSDNLALGRLVLDGAIGNLFHFQSAESHNAIYVDYLELLNSATNYNFALGVDSDFTIYFADSNISPEKLEEVGGGRVRWVSDFAGPQSSTNLIYPDGIHTFNAGVVRSRDRDDDGDGLVNAIDCTPIPVSGVDTTQPCPAMLAAASAKVFAAQDIALTIALSTASNEIILNWDASPNSVNTVEFSDSIAGGTWQALTNFINGPVNARVTVKDAVGAPLRVYRVRVDAGNP